MAKNKHPPTIDEVLSVDLSAVALPGDKIAECAFFLELATREPDRSRFRWLVSAFLSAVYSYFEIKALGAYEAYQHPESGEYIEDEDALEILRKYVHIVQNKNNPSFVKTSGLEGLVENLYELRKQNTHHYPLAIMEADGAPPHSFQFGVMPGNGTPALEFCRSVMALIHQIESELSQDAL
jgi:hypothetical protein